MKKYTYHFRTKNVTNNLDNYSGKWVAFIDNRPINWADDLNTLMQKIKREHLPKNTSVMLVPRKDEGPYILEVL